MKLFLLIALLFAAPNAQAQLLQISGSGAPTGACNGVTSYRDTSTGIQWNCVASAWQNSGISLVTGTTLNSTFPTGMIMLLISGSCPSGFTELTALNGKFLLGTLAANGDVGTIGGSNTVTPTGSASAPTFTGNSVTSSAVSGGTPAGTNSTSATTGNCAATNIAAGTGSANACKATAPNLTVTAQTFTGSVLPTHTHTLTAVGTVSAPTITVNQISVQPAFLKVIFCQKN